MTTRVDPWPPPPSDRPLTIAVVVPAGCRVCGERDALRGCYGDADDGDAWRVEYGCALAAVTAGFAAVALESIAAAGVAIILGVAAEKWGRRWSH
jgi:hypothetical protein